MGVRFAVTTVAELAPKSCVNGGGGLEAIPDWYVSMVRGNPAARGHDPAVGVLLNDASVIARIRLFPAQCQLGDQTVRVHWGMDFLTAPEFRSRGAGFFLMRHILEWLDARGEFYAAYASSEEAIRVYKPLGMIHVGRTPRYLWPLRTQPILRTRLPHAVARMVAPTLDVGLGLAARGLGALQLPSNLDWEFEPRDTFGPDIDRLEPPPNVVGWLPDSSSMLNWKLHSARGNRRRRVDLDYVRHKRTGELAGYLLTRSIYVDELEGQPYKNFRILSLVDFRLAAGRPGLEHAVVRHLMAKARSHSADVLEAVTSDKAMTQALTSARFRVVGGHDFAYKGPKAHGGALPSSPVEWRLTMAAGDGFLQ